MNDSKNEDVLKRVHFALDEIGLAKRGRVAFVAKKTGYSAGACSEFLSGKKKLSDRFLNVFFHNFGINPEWLITGRGDFSWGKTVARALSRQTEAINNQHVELGGVAAGTSQVTGDLTVTGWDEKQEVERTIKRLQDELEEGRKRQAELEDKMKKIESNFEKYRDLIVAFMYVPVEEMDEAIDVLRIVQKTTADNPNLPGPLK